MALASNAIANTLTFDDLGPSTLGEPVPAGYAGFTWGSSWKFITEASAPTDTTYLALSDGTAAFILRSDIKFVYDGAVFWSRRAQDANGSLWIQLRLDGQLVYDGIALDDRLDFTATPQFFASNYTGLVDTVVLAQFGGGGGGANGADWDHLAMDDFQFTPEASTPDTTPPVVTAPADIVVETTDTNGVSATVSDIAAFLAAATATDNVDGTITAITNDAPATFPLGETTVTFSATDSANNTGTDQATVTVNLAQQNVQPLVTLSVTQNGVPTLTVDKTQGTVLVQSQVTDTNTGESHTYDWSLTDNNLVDQDGNLSDATFSFDPAAVADGVYTLTLIVTDQGGLGLSTQISQYIRVVSSTTTLSDTVDTDGDGIVDSDEGHGDSDGDGIENYLDDNQQPANVLPIDNGRVIKAENGLVLKLGSVAFAANSSIASVSETDLLNFADLGPNVDTNDTGFDHISPILDFIVSGLSAPGAAASIVMGLEQPLPANAELHKFLADQGWIVFVAGSGNAIASAASTAGVCPDTSDPSWVDGLNEGDDCVRQTLVDGGSFDADGLQNGSIEDPGVIAVAALTPTPTPTTSTSSSGGGGLFSIELLIATILLLLVESRKHLTVGRK